MIVFEFQQEVYIIVLGGFEVFQVWQILMFCLGLGKVLIKVVVVGVNCYDCNQCVQGVVYDGMLVFGFEVCGEVVMLGEGVDLGVVRKCVMVFVQGGGYV